MGWLGYFLGRSQYLYTLGINSLPERREGIDALIEGITRNKSIRRILIATTAFGDPRDQFIGNNKNLSELTFCHSAIGRQQAQNIASALRQMQHNSMRYFHICTSIISEEGLEDISREMASQPQIEYLELLDSNIGRNGCETLGNTLRSWHAPRLQSLVLENNSIDDRGLQALVEGMLNCCDLEIVKLSGNRSITAAGLRSLSTLFQSENCTLEELHLERIIIGDDGAAALVEGLVGNKSLKQLHFEVGVAGITEVGWSAFSKLLCDTSTINDTYLSNHTLEWIGEGDDRGASEDVAELLEWNVDFNEDDAAIWKILRHFNDYDELDIESLFRWKLKFLPFLVTWFERARSSIAPWVTNDSDFSDLEKRKLSAVHKFVLGMPLLIIDGYNSRRTNTRLARKRGLDGDAKN